MPIIIFLVLFALAVFGGRALDAPREAFIKDCVVEKHKDVATCKYLYQLDNNLPIN